MAKVVLSAEILIRGINPYVLISKDQAEKIKTGWRKPLPVVIRVNGQPAESWHINMMPAGNGDFYLYLHGDVRKASSTNIGDTVSVEIAFDVNYRNGPQAMPEWFAKALADLPIASANWNKLSPSRQKELVRYMCGLKSSKAKSTNLERALNVLSGADDRFMARDWHNGS